MGFCIDCSSMCVVLDCVLFLVEKHANPRDVFKNLLRRFYLVTMILMAFFILMLPRIYSDWLLKHWRSFGKFSWRDL